MAVCRKTLQVGKAEPFLTQKRTIAGAAGRYFSSGRPPQETQE
jgi:hypothetical protein